mmetsp:Transcript_49196/g.158802  ORF Transcript_49196/g.158802 Transcript_49196/m.158802 type:complete len:830 (+) Transcript_49196:85-2574(+)
MVDSAFDDYAFQSALDSQFEGLGRLRSEHSRLLAALQGELRRAEERASELTGRNSRSGMDEVHSCAYSSQRSLIGADDDDDDADSFCAVVPDAIPHERQAVRSEGSAKDKSVADLTPLCSIPRERSRLDLALDESQKVAAALELCSGVQQDPTFSPSKLTQKQTSQVSRACSCCGNCVKPDSRFCRRCGTQVGVAGRQCECGSVLSADSLFCGMCGEQAGGKRICQCGVVVDPNSAFCQQCGTRWKRQHSVLEAGGFTTLPIWRQASHNNLPLARLTGFDASMSPKTTTSISGRGKLGKALDPASKRRCTWDVCMLAFLMYDVIVLPTLFLDFEEPAIFKAMSWTLRVFWTLDVPLSFLTGYRRQDGEIELRLDKVRQHYMHGWMLVDLVMVIGDWALGADGEDDVSSSGARSVKMLRASRMLRMIRMVRIYRIALLSRKYAVLFHYKSLSANATVALEIVRVIVLMLLVAHFIACFWYFLGSHRFNAGTDVADAWMVVSGTDSLDVGGRYLVSYHWAMSNFVGNMNLEGNTTAERLYSIFVLVFAFMVLAVVPPRITALMTRLSTAAVEQNALLTQLKLYLQDNGASAELAVRVERVAAGALRVHQQKTPESDVKLLRLLPEGTRSALHWEIFSPRLLIHPLFRRVFDQSPALGQQICHKAVSTTDLADEGVLFQAWFSSDLPVMYFLSSGKLSYTHATAHESEEVGPGSWLAEPLLWTSWIYRGDAIAQEDCSLLVVSAKSFQDEVLKSSLQKEVRRYAEQFVKWLNGLEADVLTDVSTPREDLVKQTVFLTSSAFRTRVFSEPEEHTKFKAPSHSRTSDGTFEFAI